MNYSITVKFPSYMKKYYQNGREGKMRKINLKNGKHNFRMVLSALVSA